MAPTESANPPATPKMKMSTPIPPSITTPESVDTRIGTLKFFDGFDWRRQSESKNRGCCPRLK
jgi:hypothetical protein